jgi:thiopurine S-methyltransferase
MDSEYWAARWRNGQTNFNEGQPNAQLLRHVGVLGPASCVFVPLAGRSLDMSFLASQGHRVIAVELVADALLQFAEEIGISGALERRDEGGFQVYSCAPYTLIAGDFFALTRSMLAGAAAFYDRAACVAMPPHMRPRYAAQLRALLPNARGLVVTLEMDQEPSVGPPFSVPEQELRSYVESLKHLEDAWLDPRPGETAPRCARAFCVKLGA